jgi:CHAD domain-containing protein
MAYRVRPDESFSGGLRRLAAKQIRSARDELRRSNPPRDEAIHQARRSIKKTRAIHRLIEDDGGRGLDGCGKRLKRVSRALSELRDADAMIAILTKLRNRYPRLFTEHGFARVRRELKVLKRQAMETADRDDLWTMVDRELRELRRKAKQWRPAHGGSGTLTRSIRFIHRRGRKALARARKRSRAADFHEWRKQVKTLWTNCVSSSAPVAPSNAT